MSALVKAFVMCYGHYDEARARVKYISDFSTTATIAPHEAFKREKIKHLLDNADSYFFNLYMEMERGVGSTYIAVFAIDAQLVSRLLVYN